MSRELKCLLKIHCIQCHEIKLLSRSDSVKTFKSNQMKGKLGAASRRQHNLRAKVVRKKRGIQMVPKTKLSHDEQSSRRSPISYLFRCIYGSPQEEQWQEAGVVKGIMRKVEIPLGSSAKVKEVMHNCLDSECHSRCYRWPGGSSGQCRGVIGRAGAGRRRRFRAGGRVKTKYVGR